MPVYVIEYFDYFENGAFDKCCLDDARYTSKKDAHDALLGLFYHKIEDENPYGMVHERLDSIQTASSDPLDYYLLEDEVVVGTATIRKVSQERTDLIMWDKFYQK